MAKAILDSVDSLPADVQKEYKKAEDGRFYLTVEPVDGWELVGGNMRGALEKERATNKTLTSQVKKFDGLDPDAARAAIAKVAEFGDLDPEGKVKEALAIREKQLVDKYDADRKKLIEKYDGDSAKQAASIKLLTTQLQENLITSAATAAIAEAKGSIDLLLPIVQRHARMTQAEDGKVGVEVLDANGQAMLTRKAGKNDAMGIPEFVTEVLRPDTKYARAFDNTASGSGARGDGGTSKSGSFTISEEDAHDPHKYRLAKANAEKAGQQLQVTSASN